MNIKSLKKKCLIIIMAVACALFACIAVSGISSSVAYASVGATTVDDIWNGGSSASSHFSVDNLNTLAAKAGYSSIGEMVSDAEGGTVKNAADLAAANGGNEWSVNLDGFVFNPMYLSKDTDGNAILTLWLAESSDTSTWSDGTYSTSESQSFNDSTIYSNTYDGSYIHNYVLNGRSTYTTSWGSQTSQSANSTLMNKYALLRASGGIGDYIVTPSKVSWQTTVPTSWKNDPSYNGTSKGTIENYPCNWMNDKLWLPSIYETYDKTNTNTTTVTLDNGLWNTSVAQRSNSLNSWLRSGNFSNYFSAYILTSSGAGGSSAVGNSYAVRPALHLNLTSAASHAASAIDPPSDVPATKYDGTSKKIEDMATKPSWYNPAMTFAYKKAGAAVTAVTDAGVYSVDVTLTGGLLFDTSDGGSSTLRTINLTVDKKEVFIASGITASNKDYDGNTTATLTCSGAVITGKVGSDDLTVASATGVFATKTAGTGKTVNISGITLGGAKAANYTLATSGNQATTTADINALTVTVASGITVSGGTKQYDGNTTAVADFSGASITGKVSGDNLTVTATLSYSDKNVGTGKTVNITGLALDGSDKDNYVLAASGNQATCTADITAKSVSVSGVTANNKEYDGTTDATLDFSGVTFNGIIAGDTLTVTATGTFDSANAGFGRVVTITGLTLTGADAANYTLAVSGQQTECTADINVKVVTVSGILANSRQYDGTDTASFDCSSAVIAGLTAGDDVTISVTGTFADSNVGSGLTVSITSITLDGADCGKYMLDFASSQQTATADITRRELTVDITADDHDANDGATPATVVLNNVLDGETVDYVLLYTGKTAKDEAYSSADAPAAKGEYKASVTIDESVFTNYTLTGVTEKSFIITQTVGDDEGNKAGIPWWVWLIVALAVAILIGIIVVIIVVAKKKKKGDDDTPYDGTGGNGGDDGKGGSNGIKNPPENASAQGNV